MHYTKSEWYKRATGKKQSLFWDPYTRRDNNSARFVGGWGFNPSLSGASQPQPKK